MSTRLEPREVNESNRPGPVANLITVGRAQLTTAKSRFSLDITAQVADLSDFDRLGRLDLGHCKAVTVSPYLRPHISPL